MSGATPHEIARLANQVPRNQQGHTLNAHWRSDGGELDPVVTVTCPYRPDDHKKPCRIWTEEYDNGVYEDGCWVEQVVEACGWADLYVILPNRYEVYMPMTVYVGGSGDDGPRLVHSHLAEHTLEATFLLPPIAAHCTSSSEVES